MNVRNPSLPLKMNPILNTIIEDYTHFIGDIDGQADTSLMRVQEEAMKELVRLGIPTIRHEDWKYTNLYWLLSKQFKNSFRYSYSTRVPDDTTSYFRKWGDITKVINGIDIETSNPTLVTTLKDRIFPDYQSLNRIGTLARFQNNAVVAWNMAFLQNGTVIEIPDGVDVTRPLVVVSVIAAEGNNVVAHERHLITIQPNSRAQIVFAYRSIGDHETLLNQIIECRVNDNSHLDVVIVQDGPPSAHAITTHEYELGRNSSIRLVTISIGGGFVRNMPAVRLAGENANAELYGFTFATNSSLIDHHTIVDHIAPHSVSNELYKAILDDKATGVFNGKIYVRPGAQKTSAYQANRNIVLSSRATINTKPQLEIYANDVRCTHGCTVGRLDREALFYLRTRGLSKEEAEILLLTAFGDEIIGLIPCEQIRIDIGAIIRQIFHADDLE